MDNSNIDYYIKIYGTIPRFLALRLYTVSKAKKMYPRYDSNTYDSNPIKGCPLLIHNA